MATSSDMTDKPYESDATTTEAETTDAETTEEEIEPLGDLELEVFKESLQGKSKNTISTYTRMFDKLKKGLGKDIHQSSQQLIIKTSQELSSNLNSQASLINIGFLIRQLYNMDVKELAKARQVKKMSIIDHTRATNTALGNTLPSLKEFDDHLDYLFEHKHYNQFVINFLIRNCYVRNQDLLFEIIKKKGDAVGQKNYMWLAKGGKGPARAVYIRRDYKTASTYGEKVTEITDKRLLTALRTLKSPLIPNPDSLGYFVRKNSFRELGEGALLKIVLEDTRTSGDWNKLQEISKLRGTDVCTLTSSYNIQRDSDEGKTTITRSGKAKKKPS